MLRFALIALLLTACETTGTGPGRQEEGDASAQLACTHFRNVANDAAAGILTDAELREKLREVHSDAQYSEEPGIAEAAEDMLAASTAGDLDQLEDAVGRMDSACTAAGY